MKIHALNPVGEQPGRTTLTRDGHEVGFVEWYDLSGWYAARTLPSIHDPAADKPVPLDERRQWFTRAEYGEAVAWVAANPFARTDEFGKAGAK